MKKVITIGHTKGGVGKSTVTWSMAIYLSLYAKREVTVIDLDFQQTIFALNNIRVNDAKLDGLSVIQPSSAEALIDAIDSIDGIIIIDVGGFDNDITRMAIDYCDTLIVPISDSMTEAVGLNTFKAIIDEIDTQADIKALLNNVHPSRKNFDDIIEAIKPIETLNSIIKNRVSHKDAMKDGKCAVEIDEKAYTQIESLIQEIGLL
jgi:chromosome partitioning protein